MQNPLPPLPGGRNRTYPGFFVHGLYPPAKLKFPPHGRGAIGWCGGREGFMRPV